jgi:hypothetical protein
MNDLIGLEYGWGHAPGDGSGRTDCFQLTCEARDRLGLSSYRDKFAWVYEKWTEETFPNGMLLRWLLTFGDRLETPQPGAVALLPSRAGRALGTCTESGVVFIGPGRTVVCAPLATESATFFWMSR